MWSYLTLICCLSLLSHGALASRTSASFSISASSNGRGGSHITAHHSSSAEGPRASAVIGTSATASTRNSQAAINHNSLSISDRQGGQTNAQVNTDAQTSGNGRVHVTGDATAANRGSESSADHQVAVESGPGGSADVVGSVGVSSDRRGSDALFTNAGGSTGSGSAVITSEARGENRRGKLRAKQQLAAGSEFGGSSDAEAGLEAGFDSLGSRLLSVLRGQTRGEAAVVLGNEGAAVGPQGASAGKSDLVAQSAGRFPLRRGRLQHRKFHGGRRTSSSFGKISAGTQGGVRNADSTASADGEVIRDGTVAATAEFGSLGKNFDDNTVKASLIIDAEEPERRISRRRSHRRQNRFRRNNRAQFRL